MRSPDSSETWVALTRDPLPVGEAYEWAVLDSCGAVVLFSGTVRDHAADDHGVMRTDVVHLEYEAYEGQCTTVFERIVDELRERWPHTGRVALLHRLGRLELGDSSVIAVVSAPHRPEAFAAARYAIDALKASAPIWKRETWRTAGGDDAAWGTGAHVPIDPAAVPSIDTASIDTTSIDTTGIDPSGAGTASEPASGAELHSVGGDPAARGT